MNADSTAQQPTPPTPTFDSLSLTAEVRRAIDEMGFTEPTPVQLAVYEPAASGSDLIVQARTGTGKTAAFGLPLVDKRIRQGAGQQALILAPTRELALQSAREIERLGKHKDVRVVAVYGGAPMERQVREIEEGAQIVSGTPGRVLDHLKRGTLRGDDIRILILDEADEMLSMGFARELNAIVEHLPKARQTMLFSATLDDSVQRLSQRLMRDPVTITLSSDAVGALTISHFVYMISGVGKTRDLIRILETEDPESAILFCNTKATTEQVAAELQHAGFQADWLNGDLPQSDREKVLARTRKGELRYLVATDVAARGIDISHLTHVINYDFPDHIEAYVHRTGRTGRAGRTGTAISLITPQDLGALYYVRLAYKIFPIERSLASAGEVRARKELDRIDMLSEAFKEGPREEDRAIARRLLVHDDAEQIVGGLLRAFFGTQAADTSEVDEQAAAARRARAPRQGLGASEPPAAAEAPRAQRRDGSASREGRPRPGRDERASAERADETGGPSRAERAGGDAGGPSRAERGDASGPSRAERAGGDAGSRVEVGGPSRAERAGGERGGLDADEAERGRRRRRRERSPEPALEATTEVGADAPAEPSIAQMIAAPAPSEGPAERLDEPPSSADASAESDPSMSTLFLNLGRRDGVRVVDILRLFEDHAGLSKDDLGRIRIRDRHSFVGVPKERVDAALASLAGKTSHDKEIVVEIARAEQRAAEPAPQS